MVELLSNANTNTNTNAKTKANTNDGVTESLTIDVPHCDGVAVKSAPSDGPSP